MGEHKRVLAVDDEERVLFVVQHAVQCPGNGLVVDIASGGREALEKVRETHYDLVVTDVRMPDIDGIELTRAIRSGNNHTAVIWLTAHDSRELHTQARKLGVENYLTKPIAIGAIREAVRVALDRSDAQAAD